MNRIRINGIVQGVGFRPFVYKTAKKYNLRGYVLNSNDGVEIEVEGKESDLVIFIETIKKNHPPIARINHISIEKFPDIGYPDFLIRNSNESCGSTFISPDLRICLDCIDELHNPENIRYKYPFINCTNCGPRYSIILTTPYDRPLTSMKSFAMCNVCRREYEDPNDRRFHAQPVACPDCGPQLSFLDSLYNEIDGDPITNCYNELKKGKVIGIKGIGGFHIACDATNEASVSELRRRKKRPAKPFAIMCNINHLRNIVKCTDPISALLQSPLAPVVILPKVSPSPIAESVAPQNANLGVFLPYAPHQIMIFSEFDALEPLYLVMTSGNLNDEPIATDEKELIGLCDFYLTHNRTILNRCDDSVVVPSSKCNVILRRSRGYVPSPIHLPFVSDSILGTGAELKIAFCLADDELYYMSPYIGNNNSKDTEDFFKEMLDKYQEWFKIKPKLAGCDLHPDYLTTHIAERMRIPLVRIQHHHAHIAAVMAENKLDETVIGVSFDGSGYGNDGAIWGGEIFTTDYLGFERQYHLCYMPLSGGDAAVKRPVRIAYAYLEFAGISNSFLKGMSEFEKKIVSQQVKNNFNLFQTSSMGRLFDCVGAMLGLYPEITFEAQSAIALEQMCNIKFLSEVTAYRYRILKNEIDIKPLLEDIRNDIVKGKSHALIALRFHKTIIEFTVNAIREVKSKTNIDKVVLSGGVMQNMILFESLIIELCKNNFQVYFSTELPNNDGAIALGQVIIAGRMKGKVKNVFGNSGANSKENK